jgi:hypothetical protein
MVGPRAWPDGIRLLFVQGVVGPVSQSHHEHGKLCYHIRYTLL